MRSAERPVSVYTENLDLGRFGNARFTGTVEAFLREKYRDTPIGLVVSIGSTALELVLSLRTPLWPDTPVVFIAVDEDAPQRLKLPTNVTGLTMPAPLSDSVIVARAIVPGLARIAIVGDPPERQFIRRLVPAQLEELAAEFELTDLTRLRMADLKQRVASLPSHSAIIYVGMTADADNVAYTSYDALALLAPLANRPIIVQADTNIGTGAVGGIVASFTLMGQQAAQLTLRILAGESPVNIPVVSSNAMKPVFDWRQLERWGIHESQLPAGSEIRFRDPSSWQQYRTAVLIACAVVLLQGVLISWLLYEHRQRRVSESAAHALSGRLIGAHEEERSRLARELHDDVTQRLAMLAIDAGREERNPAGATARSAMQRMREGLVRLSEDVHALSYRLHSSILDDLGLLEALRAECARFGKAFSIRLDVLPEDIPEALPHEVALCLFRIAQEALRNVSRHSQASRADVTLRPHNGGLRLVVRDNGLGFRPGRRMGMSLGHASMRQRASLLGGTLEIESGPAQGVTIVAWVPLKGDVP
ncbi:MAG: ABC transporter substrate binding protein [Xanthobacteraceae bacterium]